MKSFRFGSLGASLIGTSIVFLPFFASGVDTPADAFYSVDVTTVWSTGKTSLRRDVLRRDKDGALVWRCPKETLSAGVSSVLVMPVFSKATAGEAGYFLLPNGARTFFKADRDFYRCTPAIWNLMPVYGMKTPRAAFVAVAEGMAWHARILREAKKNVYSAAFLFCEDMDNIYEDLSVRYYFLEGASADYNGMAAAYRKYQLARGACRPLKERAKERPVLAYAASNLEVRIRQAWKPVPSPVTNQVPENAPPVHPACTFDRVADLARGCHKAGVKGAEFCLVGWNLGGHDGAYPQLFPVEPALGGEERLKACVKTVQALGYQIVAHGNHRDCYKIADSWDVEYVREKRSDGTLYPPECTWGAGGKYTICAQRAYERFALRDAPRVAALGFKGLYYLDVTTCTGPYTCRDRRHPMTRRETIGWENAILDIQTATFGGCASEGANDAYIGHYDSALTVCWGDPLKPPAKGMDDYVPFWQLVYHGIVLSTPFRCVCNTPAQTDVRYALKMVEYGGRMLFYVHSNFINTRAAFMGKADLLTASEEELNKTIAWIKQGYDEFARRSDLQFEFMTHHDEVAPQVFKTTYANGAYTLVNYNDKPVLVSGVKVGALDSVCVR